MKLIVKVLNGQECTITTSPSSGVCDVKEQLEALLSIPVSEQKLVFKGKSLLDEKLLKDYSVEDGSKLTLVVKKVPGAASPATNVSTAAPKVESAASIKAEMEVEERPVWTKLRTFLKRHYREKDAEAVLIELKKEFERNLCSLSLDDIERLAITKLRQA